MGSGIEYVEMGWCEVGSCSVSEAATTDDDNNDDITEVYTFHLVNNEPVRQ
jgi:hypothetical protein